ncbi:ferredoxin-dependent glutamate synthase 2, chloroplastic-like [Selaginella moellendorffii]|uniref:ferredoxin-dependent glutamate synthase 2, chloroplastic-like n=1 Tax=Selaginella moellendorffii TaxID=88036 RepID=UPI000D1CB0F9|nr:ferredoxin-dependent glutamate synthase 2, chloroplastic-like [Selaginella moellendorffii]|eukprot:XP_024542722.1 ferredoxin-dependent glutamate synthase 2, chloroplastic-like [Selaginella moellendorffii]
MIGFVMARICHTNYCPVGVASQGEELRARFPGVRGLLAHLGSEKLNDVIGRVCGRIAGSIAKAYGGHSSGQSFECLLTPGMNIRLIGESNDYVGKGMAGGELAIIPPEMTGFVPEDATIIHASTELLEASSVHAERLVNDLPFETAARRLLSLEANTSSVFRVL